MIGAIAGDVIGPVHEHRGTKSTAFPLFEHRSRFTDDTVLTIATAHAILTGTPYDTAYRTFGRAYPDAGYGGSFHRWLMSDEPRPYNSFGNGSAMRVSPVGFAFDGIDAVLQEAARSAAVTHDHREGIKGAQAVALAVFMARTGSSRADIRDELVRRFRYDLHRTIDDIRSHYSWSVSCQGSVPHAIVAFLDSTSVESAIRLAVSLGGDADTQAAIAGGIAEAFYGEVPEAIVAGVRERLPADFIAILEAFTRAFPASAAPARPLRRPEADGGTHDNAGDA
jgi:ADP-ribosylglycohydrolase